MNHIDAVANHILQSDRILFITGAGVSADSGLPTYRGVGGLYDGNHTEDGISIEEALSGSMLHSRPDITWKYLWQIGTACHGAKPNQAHHIIAKIQQHKPNAWVLTQNVDDFHHQAGSNNLIEIHGNAYSLHCMACQQHYDAHNLINAYEGQISLPPKCMDCGGLVRPDVVLFGEMLPEQALSDLYAFYQGGIDMVVSIGTSGAFPYIQEPLLAAKMAGKPTVEINPSTTETSALVDYHIALGAADALGLIWQSLSYAEEH